MIWVQRDDMEILLDDSRKPPMVCGAIRKGSDGIEAMVTLPSTKKIGSFPTPHLARQAVESNHLGQNN